MTAASGSSPVRAVCPGSFDPVTRGHLDVIERTAALFDEVVVAVGINPAKAGFFTVDERVALLTEACRSWAGVSVVAFSGLVVDLCRERGASVIVKGVRAGDFDYELSMAQMNRAMSGVDTVLLPSSAQWSFVSSSLVREIARHGGDVAPFLSAEVARHTAERGAQVENSTAERGAAVGTSTAERGSERAPLTDRPGAAGSPGP